MSRISHRCARSLAGDLTICWGPISVFLVWLATSAGRAMAAGRTAVGALKAARAKGRRKRAFMLGVWRCGSARCGQEPIGGAERSRTERSGRTGRGDSGPGARSSDGVAGLRRREG